MSIAISNHHSLPVESLYEARQKKHMLDGHAVEKMREDGWSKQRSHSLRKISRAAIRQLTTEDIRKLSSSQSACLRKSQLREMSDVQFISILPKLSPQQIRDQLNSFSSGMLIKIHNHMTPAQRPAVMGSLYDHSLYHYATPIPERLLSKVPTAKSGVLRMALAVVKENHKPGNHKAGLLFSRMTAHQRHEVSSLLSSSDIGFGISQMHRDQAAEALYSFDKNQRVLIEENIPSRKLSAIRHTQSKKVAAKVI